MKPSFAITIQIDPDQYQIHKEPSTNPNMLYLWPHDRSMLSYSFAPDGAIHSFKLSICNGDPSRSISVKEFHKIIKGWKSFGGTVRLVTPNPTSHAKSNS